MNFNGLYNDLGDGDGLNQDLPIQDTQQGLLRINIDNVYEGDVYTLRWLQVQNYSDESIVVRLRSNLGKQVAFQLYNENLNQTMDENEHNTDSDNELDLLTQNSNPQTFPLFSVRMLESPLVQNEFPERNHNQIFNNINHIDEIELFPLKKKRFVLCFLPIDYNSQTKRKKIYNDINEQKNIRSYLNGFHEVNGILFFLGYKKKHLLENDCLENLEPSDIINDGNTRQINSLPPDYKVIARFRSRVCFSVMKVDLEDTVIFFPSCTINKLYYKDLTLINCSAIKLFWTLNAEDLFNKKEVDINFIDPDTNSPLEFAPVMPYSQKKIRVTFLPKEVGEFSYEFQLENVVNSDNFITVSVNAIVSSDYLKDPVLISPDSTLDFGACYSGIWNQQTINIKSVSELPVDILFRSSIEDVKFKIKDYDLLVNSVPPIEPDIPMSPFDEKSSNNNEHDEITFNSLPEKNQRDYAYYDDGQDVSDSSGTIVMDNIDKEHQFHRNELIDSYEQKGNLSSLFDFVLIETRHPLTPSNAIIYDKDENKSNNDDDELLEDDIEEDENFKFSLPNYSPEKDIVLDENLSSHNNDIIHEEHGLVEEINLRPGTERTIEILYKQKLDPRTADFWGGQLMKRDFKISVWSTVTGTNNVNKKTIHCKAHTCTSFLKLRPENIEFGDTYINTTKTRNFSVINMSDLSVKFYCKCISKTLSLTNEVQSIPPNGKITLDIHINPKRATSDYKKIIKIINLYNISDEHELHISSTNIDNMSYKTLNSFFYHVTFPTYDNIIDFGVSTYNSPVVRSFKIFNVSKSKINLLLSSSMPEDVEMFTINKNYDDVNLKRCKMTEIRERTIEILHPRNILGGLDNSDNQYAKSIVVKNNFRNSNHIKSSLDSSMDNVHKISNFYGYVPVSSNLQKKDTYVNNIVRDNETHNLVNDFNNYPNLYYDEEMLDRINFLDLAITPIKSEVKRLNSVVNNNNLYTNQTISSFLTQKHCTMKDIDNLNIDCFGEEYANNSTKPKLKCMKNSFLMSGHYIDPHLINNSGLDTYNKDLTIEKGIGLKRSLTDHCAKIPFKTTSSEVKEFLCNINNSSNISNDKMKTHYDDADSSKLYNNKQFPSNIFTQNENQNEKSTSDKGNISTSVLLSYLESITGYYPGKFKNPEHCETYVRSVMFLMRELRYAIKYGRLIKISSLTLNSEEESQVLVLYTPKARGDLEEYVGNMLVEGKIYVKLEEYDREVLISGLHSQCDKNTIKSNFNLNKLNETDVPIYKINMKSIICSSTIRVNQKNINFGYINRYEVYKKSIVILSHSNLPVLYSLVKSGSIASGNIIFSEGRLGIVPPLGRKRVEFTFKPTLHGNFHEIIKIENITNPGESLAVSLKATVREKNEFFISDTYIDFGTISIGNECANKRHITISNANFKKTKYFEVSVNPTEGEMEDIGLELVFEKIEPNSENILYMNIPSPKYMLTKEAEERIEALEAKLEIAKRKRRDQTTAKILSELQRLKSGVDSYFNNDENEVLNFIPQNSKSDDVNTLSRTIYNEANTLKNEPISTSTTYLTTNPNMDHYEMKTLEKNFEDNNNIQSSTTYNLNELNQKNSEIYNSSYLLRPTIHNNEYPQILTEIQFSSNIRNISNGISGYQPPNIQILSYKRNFNKIYFTVDPRVVQPIVIYPRLSFNFSEKNEKKSPMGLAEIDEIPVTGTFQIYEYKNKDVIKTVHYHSKFTFKDNDYSRENTKKFDDDNICQTSENINYVSTSNGVLESNLIRKNISKIITASTVIPQEMREGHHPQIEALKLHSEFPILITSSNTSQKYANTTCGCVTYNPQRGNEGSDCGVHSEINKNNDDNKYLDNAKSLHNIVLIKNNELINTSNNVENLGGSYNSNGKKPCELHYEVVDLGNITISTRKTCVAFLYNNYANEKTINIVMNIKSSDVFYVTNLKKNETLNEGEKTKIEFTFVPTAHGNHSIILNINFLNSEFPQFEIEYMYYAVYKSYIIFPTLAQDSPFLLDMGFSYIDSNTGQVKPRRLPIKNCTELDIYLSVKSNLPKQCLVTLNEDICENSSLVKVPAMCSIDAFVIPRSLHFSQPNNTYNSNSGPVDANAITKLKLDTYSEAFRVLKGGLKFMVYIENGEESTVARSSGNAVMIKGDDNNESSEGSICRSGTKLGLTKTLMFTTTIGISTLEVNTSFIKFETLSVPIILEGNFEVKNLENRLPLSFYVMCDSDSITILPHDSKISERDTYDKKECSRQVKFNLEIKTHGFCLHKIIVKNNNNPSQIVTLEVWAFANPKLIEYTPDVINDPQNEVFHSTINWQPVFAMCSLPYKNYSENPVDITHNDFFISNSFEYQKSLERCFYIKNISNKVLELIIYSKLKLKVFLENNNNNNFFTNNHKLFYKPESSEDTLFNYGKITLSKGEKKKIKISVPMLPANTINESFLLKHKIVDNSGVLHFESTSIKSVVSSIFLNMSYVIPYLDVNMNSINLGKLGFANAWKSVQFNFTVFNVSECKLQYELTIPQNVNLKYVQDMNSTTEVICNELIPIKVDEVRRAYVYELGELSKSNVYCELEIIQEEIIEEKESIVELKILNIFNVANTETISIRFSVTTPGITFGQLDPDGLHLSALKHPYIPEAAQSDTWVSIKNTSDTEPTLELLYELNPLLNNLVKLSLRSRKFGTPSQGVLKLAPNEKIEFRIIAQAIEGSRMPGEFKDLINMENILFGELSVFLRSNYQLSQNTQVNTDSNSPICIKKIPLNGKIIEESTFMLSSQHLHLYNERNSLESDTGIPASDTDILPKYNSNNLFASTNTSNIEKNNLVITNLLKQLPLEISYTVEYPIELSKPEGIISISPLNNNNTAIIEPGGCLPLNIFLLDRYIFGSSEDIKIHFVDCASIKKLPQTLYISIRENFESESYNNKNSTSENNII